MIGNYSILMKILENKAFKEFLMNIGDIMFFLLETKHVKMIKFFACKDFFYIFNVRKYDYIARFSNYFVDRRITYRLKEYKYFDEIDEIKKNKIDKIISFISNRYDVEDW